MTVFLPRFIKHPEINREAYIQHLLFRIKIITARTTCIISEFLPFIFEPPFCKTVSKLSNKLLILDKHLRICLGCKKKIKKIIDYIEEAPYRNAYKLYYYIPEFKKHTIVQNTIGGKATGWDLREVIHRTYPLYALTSGHMLLRDDQLLCYAAFIVWLLIN